MTLDFISTLFPAIPLAIVALNLRYTSLAGLMRNLAAQIETPNQSPALTDILVKELQMMQVRITLVKYALFFALCGAWLLAYLNISEPAFKIAGGIILFLVSLDMLSAKRQTRKRDESTSDTNDIEAENVAIYPLAIPMLAGPAAIISVIVVNASFSDALASTLIGYTALLAVMASTGVILCLTVIAEAWLNEKVTMVFSRITAIVLAGLSVQYVLDGLMVLQR